MTSGGADSSFDGLLASVGPRSPQSAPPSADPVLAAAAAEGLMCDPNFDYEAFAATLPAPAPTPPETPPSPGGPRTLTVQIDVGQPEPVVEYDANGSPVNKWQSPVTMTLINDANGRPIKNYEYINYSPSFFGQYPLGREWAETKTVLLQSIDLDGPNGMRTDYGRTYRVDIVLSKGPFKVNYHVRFMKDNSVPEVKVAPRQIVLSP